KYRIKALLHELWTQRSINPRRYLNKAKWKGKPYWGPRFSGWEQYLDEHTPLQFNAMQWVKSVEAVKSNWTIIPEGQKLEIRYEDLISNPRQVLNQTLMFFGYRGDEFFFTAIPKLRYDNSGKWRRAFAASEVEQIKPILDPLLDELGYLKISPW
ncbi:MAG TPA: hypothetical protein ENN86_00010, partial [Desulfobacteraceae bacterium]|nr:hypothetical protein [Desulfobacteraceae bacterium]